MATRMGLEPTTSSVTGWRSNQLSYRANFYIIPFRVGGNNRARTYDPLLVRQMLSQLSYAPIYAVLSATVVIITDNFRFVKPFFHFFLFFLKNKIFLEKSRFFIPFSFFS